MVITPTVISAAADMATRAEILRIIFLWRRFKEERGEEEGFEEEELGFRTMGLGRTPGQERLTAEPQSDGLLESEEGEIVLKNAPAGSSPEKRL